MGGALSCGPQAALEGSWAGATWSGLCSRRKTLAAVGERSREPEGEQRAAQPGRLQPIDHGQPRGPEWRVVSGQWSVVSDRKGRCEWRPEGRGFLSWIEGGRRKWGRRGKSEDRKKGTIGGGPGGGRPREERARSVSVVSMCVCICVQALESMCVGVLEQRHPKSLRPP